MGSTKIILIIGLILLTLITMCGGNPRGDAYGFRYWGDGNAMHAYYTDGATGRFLGICYLRCVHHWWPRHHLLHGWRNRESTKHYTPSRSLNILSAGILLCCWSLRRWNHLLKSR
ncbi:hypothetical protein LB505_012760 [Fusarium chuoi]|nr:hypothetical protein LB505_012760 [Fusarium chuoi]